MHLILQMHWINMNSLYITFQKLYIDGARFYNVRMMNVVQTFSFLYKDVLDLYYTFTQNHICIE